MRWNPSRVPWIIEYLIKIVNILLWYSFILFISRAFPDLIICFSFIHLFIHSFSDTMINRKCFTCVPCVRLTFLCMNEWWFLSFRLDKDSKFTVCNELWNLCFQSTCSGEWQSILFIFFSFFLSFSLVIPESGMKL